MSCPVKDVENSSDGVDSKKEMSPIRPVASTSQSACPIDHTKVEYNTAANDLVFDHSKVHNQKGNLSIQRTQSTIPKSNFTPDHQPRGEQNDKWIYPSGKEIFTVL